MEMERVEQQGQGRQAATIVACGLPRPRGPTSSMSAPSSRWRSACC